GRVEVWPGVLGGRGVPDWVERRDVLRQANGGLRDRNRLPAGVAPRNGDHPDSLAIGPHFTHRAGGVHRRPLACLRVSPLLPARRRGGHHMGMAAPIYWTAEMVRALPDDGNKYEVVYGDLLVTPAPRMWHEVVESRLRHAIADYLRVEPLGIALGSRADISWG